MPATTLSRKVVRSYIYIDEIERLRYRRLAQQDESLLRASGRENRHRSRAEEAVEEAPPHRRAGHADAVALRAEDRVPHVQGRLRQALQEVLRVRPGRRSGRDLLRRAV